MTAFPSALHLCSGCRRMRYVRCVFCPSAASLWSMCAGWVPEAAEMVLLWRALSTEQKSMKFEWLWPETGGKFPPPPPPYIFLDRLDICKYILPKVNLWKTGRNTEICAGEWTCYSNSLFILFSAFCSLSSRPTQCPCRRTIGNTRQHRFLLFCSPPPWCAAPAGAVPRSTATDRSAGGRWGAVLCCLTRVLLPESVCSVPMASN